jgi:hypothetical protein
MHEKLTAFLELEAALWIFNQRLSLLIREAPHFIGDPLINLNKFKRLSAC